MPLILLVTTLGILRQKNCLEFETSLAPKEKGGKKVRNS